MSSENNAGYKLDAPTLTAVIDIITSYMETGQLPNGGGGGTTLIGSLSSTSTLAALRADQGPVIAGLVSTAQLAATTANIAAGNAQVAADFAQSTANDALAANSGTILATAPATAISLDKSTGRYFNSDVYVSNTPFTVAGGRVSGGYCTLVIKGDGVLSPTFTGMLKAANSSAFNTTFNAVNNVLIFEQGGRTYYNIWQADPVEIATAPVTPVNTAPTIIGTPTAGTAVAWAGQSVTGYPAPTTVFNWLTYPGATLIQANITSGSYTPPATGQFILQMVSTNSQGTDTDNVIVTVAVAPAGVPVNSTIPTITGTTTVGQTLTATTGTWTNSPTGYTYQWKRAGSNISGATASTYTLVVADAGTVITVAVVAANGAGPATAAAVSASTASINAIAPDAPTLAGVTAITATGLTYTWTDGSNGGSTVTARNADISFDGGAWTAIATPTVGSNTITFTGDGSVRTAQIRGRATNAVGVGAYGTVTGISIPANVVLSLRFTSLVNGTVESGSGPYTYTQTTPGAYQRGDLVVENLRMPANAASTLTMRSFITTPAGSASPFVQFSMVNADTTTAPSVPFSDSTGLVAYVTSGNGSAAIFSNFPSSGAYPSDMRYWRFSRAVNGDLTAHYSNDNATWLQFGNAAIASNPASPLWPRVSLYSDNAGHVHGVEIVAQSGMEAS